MSQLRDSDYHDLKKTLLHRRVQIGPITWMITDVAPHVDPGGWPLLDLQMRAVSGNELEPVLILTDKDLLDG